MLKNDHLRPAIKRVAVIGAGVMGQAIAAHMINAGLDCVLLDIPQPGNDRNKLAHDALKKIELSKPNLAFTNTSIKNIKTGNTEDDLSLIKNCDLVIEAVLEKIDIKRQLFSKIAQVREPHTIIASNTSGLSVSEMMKDLPKSFAEHFLVMHFFNPVRYLHLLEIVPSVHTKPAIIASMRQFAEEKLGKGVVIGKDTTNFIANRVGVYGMMEAIKSLKDYSVEEIDAVFGPALGRPKSAIFRTADVVGIDTFIHVASNCYEHLLQDEQREVFKISDFVHQMAQKNYLGQKTGQGFYKKDGDKILVLDPKTLSYHEKQKLRFDSLGAIRNISGLKAKIAFMMESNDRASEIFFLLSAKTSAYAAFRLGEIADDIATIDKALRWGFAWEMGPFEAWDAMGVRTSVERMKKANIAVPAWVIKMLDSGRENFYEEAADGSVSVYCPQKGSSVLKVESQEWQIDRLKKDKKSLIKDSDAYSLLEADGALIVEFHSKMNAIDNDILKGINEALDLCEAGKFEALVLANDGQNFSVGANLLLLYMAASQGMWKEIEEIVELFQKTGQRLRYSPIPTVAAPFQLTFGGGCELSMWCDHIHAHAETYIGLVEVGVGLLPGGGGTVELLARSLKGSIDSPTFVTEPFIMRAFETVAKAKVATSAEEAKELLYLDARDSYSMNRRYQLHDATTRALALAHGGYKPTAKRNFRLPGKNAYATFALGLQAYVLGNYISEHDHKIALKIAHVMTGGQTDSNNYISEDDLLSLEREAFLSLCGEEKTMQRIAYMLEHNKPLRN